jgi:hypothetical protein
MRIRQTIFSCNSNKGTTSSNTAFAKLAKMNVVRRFVNAQNVRRNCAFGEVFKRSD